MKIYIIIILMDDSSNQYFNINNRKNIDSINQSDTNIKIIKNKDYVMTRFKTSTYKLDSVTNILTDELKDIHELNDNYEEECKRPINYNGKLYLKSSINNNIFDYDNDDKPVGSWNIKNKNIDFKEG